jgi:predicted metal-dependent hydrolase
MTTRWGTCNTKTGKIWFNLQLAKKSQECLEYVILHELVHLVEKSHNERFVSLMDKYMPMWREVKATLNGQILDYME